MLLAVVDDRLDVHHRVAGDDALSSTERTPFSIDGNEDVADDAAEDLAGVLETAAARQRLDTQVHFGELAGAAGLLLVAILGGSLAADRLL